MNSSAEQLSNLPEEQRNMIWARLRTVEDAVGNAKLLAHEVYDIRFNQATSEQLDVSNLSDTANKYKHQVADLAAERARQENILALNDDADDARMKVRESYLQNLRKDDYEITA